LYNNYPQNGIVIVPNTLQEGDTARILYKGLLYHSGADTVYLHAGHSYNRSDWSHTKDIQMHRTPEGFEAELPIDSSEMLSVAFKDSAGHWDNNTWKNYNFEVHKREEVR
jgi:hypothetical protein